MLLTTVGKHRHDIPVCTTAHTTSANIIRQHLDEIEQQIVVLEQLSNYLTEEMSSCAHLRATCTTWGECSVTQSEKRGINCPTNWVLLRDLFREALAATP